MPIIIVLFLLLAGCAQEAERPEPVETPDFDGAGGSGGIDPCDRDEDGEVAAACGGLDCNDRNPAVNTSAVEICDGLTDENCDGTVDEGCACVPGEVRPCFPPGLDAKTRHVGACTDGLQRCDGDGVWGACEGAVVPEDEGDTCDGIDQDCDGMPDGGVSNACGLCGEEPVEICGNGLDDDCDGVIDDPERCSVRCDGVDIDDPEAGLACCVRAYDGVAPASSPSRTQWECVEWEGLATCEDRECLDLDGDPATTCEKRCSDLDGDGVPDRCVCGSPASGGGLPQPDSGCGFESPCALQDCAGRQNQPCYSGPPHTLGVGICRGGTASCVDGEEGRAWSACAGEVLPAYEICGNGIDDDCDGLIDEADGRTGARCPAPACPPGAVEICGNGLDDDCDGYPDDGCPASQQPQACYGGPLGTRGVGACRDGQQESVDGRWGPCEGQVLPSPEICGDGIDNDCNGQGEGDTEDPSCCVPLGEEVCNGIDDDCDGLVDEGVTNACGTCDESCFTTVLAELADCGAEDRSCSNVGEDPLAPGAVAVTPTKRPAEDDIHFVHRASGSNYVTRLDGSSAALVWEVQQGTGALVEAGSASITDLLSSPDGTVWVVAGGRAFHLDESGGLLCSTSHLGLRYGTLDHHGRPWIAGGFGRLFLLDRTAVEGDADDPGCVVHDLSPDDPALGSDPIGESVDITSTLLVAGPDGGIWLGGETLHRWRQDEGWTAFPLQSDGTPIHVIGVGDDGTAWARRQRQLFRMHPSAAELVQVAEVPLDRSLSHSLPTRDGSIWLGVQSFNDDANGLLRYDPVDDALSFYPSPAGLPDRRPSGLGEDGMGRIWTLFGNEPHRLDPADGGWTAFSSHLPNNPYIRAFDQLTAVGRELQAEGRWSQTIDAGFHDVHWSLLDWEANVPVGTTLQVRAAFASTREGLDAPEAACGPFEEVPVDLSSCPVEEKRFARIELLLQGGLGGASPSVRTISLGWSRP